MARARSRKRRPAGARRAPAGAGRKATQDSDGPTVAGRDGATDSGGVAVTGRDGATGRKRARASTPPASRTKPRGGPRTSPTAPTYGERPPAPWHPLPLSEVLILAGAVGAAIGFAKSRHGFSDGGPAVLAGIGAVALGTIEVTLREHRSGYRSHTVMLALIPVLLFTTAVVFGLSAVTSVPRLLFVGVLAIDLGLFALLFKVLRARFLDARHARVLRGG
jgi:hypothetical protein